MFCSCFSNPSAVSVSLRMQTNVELVAESSSVLCFMQSTKINWRGTPSLWQSTGFPRRHTHMCSVSNHSSGQLLPCPLVPLTLLQEEQWWWRMLQHRCGIQSVLRVFARKSHLPVCACSSMLQNRSLICFELAFDSTVCPIARGRHSTPRFRLAQSTSVSQDWERTRRLVGQGRSY